MKKGIELSILIILTLLGVSSLIFIRVSEYIVEGPFYIGFGGIISAFIIRFLNEKVSNYIVALLLIAGTFGLVSFFYVNYSFSFRFSDLTLIKFHPIVLMLLLLHLLANRDELNLILGASDGDESAEQKEILEIKGMKNRFANKSKDELQKIMDNPSKYQKTAVQAATELLNENDVL